MSLVQYTKGSVGAREIARRIADVMGGGGDDGSGGEGIAVFPQLGGLFAAPSGKTTINLKTGVVTVAGLAPTTYSMSNYLNNMTKRAFLTGFLFIDQPSQIKIDGLPSVLADDSLIPLTAAMSTSLEIDSYLPFSVGVILSLGAVVPRPPGATSMPFWRYGSGTTTSAFSTGVVKLAPLNVNFSKGSTPGQPTSYSPLDDSKIAVGEEGPSTVMVKRKTIIVENTGGSNSLDVNIQGNASFGGTFVDDDLAPSSGPGLITIAPNSSATFNVGKMYNRMQVRVKDTVAASHTTYKVSMMGTLGSGSS